jgi:hypothetical protein
MIKKFFTTALAVGALTAALAAQAATITFSSGSTGFYFEDVTDLWTGSFVVAYTEKDERVTLETTSYPGSFDPFLAVWDSTGKLVLFNNDKNEDNWNAFIDLGTTLTAGEEYFFTIGNWPNDLIPGVTTVDLNDIGASFALPAGQPGGKLYPSGGGGVWNVVVTGAIPEPETYAMLLAGLAVVGAVARRRKQRMH